MTTDYEQLASRYDEDRARFTVPADDIVVSLVGSNARVLDVGCGTGTWLAVQDELVAASDVTLVGTDPSAAMLTVAAGKGLRGLTMAAAERLPFADGVFDYVVSNFCFHHFDKDRALDEIARVLGPRGVFRVNNMEPPAEGWWLYEFFPEAYAIDAARFWPSDRIVGALEVRGFAVVVERFGGDEEVPASVAIRDVERRVVSQLAELDDDAFARGLARLREVAANPGATVVTTRARLCITARR